MAGHFGSMESMPALKIAGFAFALLLVQPVPPPEPQTAIRRTPEAAFDPCEPSIAISQKNPFHAVTGAVLDYAAYTTNGGKSWQQQQVKSSFGVFGDPCMISDSEGNFYFFHLASGGTGRHLDRIVCQKSTDGGKTWSDGVGIGHNAPKQQDKQWAAAHPTEPTLVCTWTEFDKYGSKDPLMESRIRFSISEDGGATWSKATTVSDITGDCIDDDGTTEGAVPAIDREGTIYVTWGLNGMILFDRSEDGGKTWLPHDRPIARQYGGWDMTIPGIDRANGMPVLVCDNSGGPNDGTLYLLFADQRNGEDNTDVFLMSSSDRGDTWSEPVRVNQEGEGHQFFPWIAVDQSDGRIYTVFYDQAGLTDNMTAVSVAWSEDGGKTFSQRRMDEPFKLQPKRFFGDYNNISAHRNMVAAAWTHVNPDGSTEIRTFFLSRWYLTELP